MSRVDYPKQNEINKQIKAIIKNSGMFEDDLTYDGFTELKPIRKKNEKIIRIIKVASSLAAIISLIVLVDFMRKPIKNIQPLKSKESVLEDNQLNNTTENYLISDTIEITYKSLDKIVEYRSNDMENIQFMFNQKWYANSNFSSIYDTANCGTLECSYPTIKSYTQEMTKTNYIEEYYTNIIERLENNIQIEYLKGRLAQSNRYTTIKYYVNSVDSINEKLITFIANEEVISEFNNMTRQYNNVYAQTFDLESGQSVELEKLFNEPEESMEYIFNRLNSYSEQQISSVVEEKNNNLMASDYLYIYNEGELNWYLTTEGIVFFINNMYYNSGANEQTQSINSGSMMINYSDFYNEGFSLNSTYINYLS